jgi:hypothetical protein
MAGMGISNSKIGSRVHDGGGTGATRTLALRYEINLSSARC